MSSHGEFSTMSSEEPSLPKSLPSSREATAEGSSGSAGGYMPLREFLDRFSLPRVVRLEGAGGRPVLLYKQQQRSLRVTATLLIHRYRHDVKVGPEIVIPEGYPDLVERDTLRLRESSVNGPKYRMVHLTIMEGNSDEFVARPNQIDKLYTKGGKHTVFLDNTVALVTQQSIYIERLMGLNCGEFSVDKNVDFWARDTWEKELEENQVLVMTTSILIDAFCHGPIFLNRINLVTVNDHPMKQLTGQFKNCSTDESKVLALAPSSLDSNVNLAKVELPIKSLEIIFHAKVAAINSAMQLKNYATAEEIIVEYNEYDIPHVGKQINDVINEIEDVLNVIVLKSSLKCIQSNEACGPKTVNKMLTSILRDIQEQFANSGVYGASKAVLLHLIQLECIKNYTRDEETTKVLGYFITELTKFRKLLEDEMKDVTDMEKIHKYSSDQVRKLFTVLKNFQINKSTNQKFSCIIFVQQQCTANVLYHILKNLSTHDEEFKFLQSDFLTRVSNNPYENSRETLCISKWNREVLVRFQNGLSNCIIATDVMEEGIDIPSCRLIVRYNGY